MTLKVIIYDFDGVLIDSRGANEAFYNRILAHFGRPPLTPAQLDYAQASTSREAVDFLFRGTPWLAAAQEYQARLDNRPFVALLRLQPQALEILKRLKPRYATAIATNRGRSLHLVLEHLGLADLFDLTVSCFDVSRPKPHPECLEKVLAHFRAKPDEAVYIGDNAVDQEVAAAAGVPFIAYRNPTLQARFHLENHLDLWKILLPGGGQAEGEAGPGREPRLPGRLNR